MTEATWTWFDHFTFGAFLGIISIQFLPKLKKRLGVLMPLWIFACGIWACLPKIAIVLQLVTEDTINNTYAFNLFFFYPIIHTIQVSYINVYWLIALFFIYSYICLHFISYAKRAAQKLERLQSNA